MRYVIQGAPRKKTILFKIHARANIDWDPTMKFIPWVGCQSKMKIPNSKITEIGRRNGKNKKNDRFRVKMDKTVEKVKKVIKFNHEII